MSELTGRLVIDLSQDVLRRLLDVSQTPTPSQTEFEVSICPTLQSNHRLVGPWVLAEGGSRAKILHVRRGSSYVFKYKAENVILSKGLVTEGNIPEDFRNSLVFCSCPFFPGSVPLENFLIPELPRIPLWDQGILRVTNYLPEVFYVCTDQFQGIFLTIVIDP